MGLKIFTIEIFQNKFLPGQTVEGNIVVQCLSDEVIKEVTVTMTGKSIVEILQTVSDSDKHQAEEVYVDTGITVVDNAIVHEGEHTYPFKFTLPTGIPSSFQFKEASVTYEIEAVLKRFNKFDKKARKQFQVVSVLDLTRVASCFQPLDENFYENVGVFGFGSGVIGFHVNFSQRGFVPGQYIRFQATFSNYSKFDLSPVSAALVQNITYGTSRSYSYKVCKAYGPHIASGRTEIWSGNILRVPTVPATNLGGGKIIGLDYFVQIVMNRPLTCGKMKKVFPITIGNMLRRRPTKTSPSSPSSITKMVKSLDSSPASSIHESSEEELKPNMTPIIEQYPSGKITDPPSYEEAIISADLYNVPFTTVTDDDKNMLIDEDSASSEVDIDEVDTDSDVESDDDWSSTQVPNYVAFSWLVPNYTSRRNFAKKAT